MPRIKAVHFNPQTFGIKARCGRQLRRVSWVLDLDDVTCNSCLRLEGRTDG